MKNINKIEDLYEEINETMTKEYGKNEKITNKWKEVNDLEELLNETLTEKQYKSVEKYGEKILELMQLERKESFIYGYKLSNKLIIDSLK